MKLLGLDHIGVVVRDIDETVARAGETVDGRAVGGRFVSDDIDLQVLLCGESTLELIEVRAAGFGMSSSWMARLPSSAISELKSMTSKTPWPN
jgi:methylmalonyl-CoA/ethylmalonyl-CoA epimerase